MAYVTVINNANSLSRGDSVELIREFDALRQELDDIRAAYMSLRALLIAGTAVGAGYNTTPTDLGTFTAATAAPPRRFTAT